MSPGDRVHVSGAAGSVIGEVISVASPWELPDLPELEAGPARGVLLEWGIVSVAMIGYNRPPRVVFAALELNDGRWFDLRGQELSISPAAAPAQPREGSRRARSSAPRGKRVIESRSLPSPAKEGIPPA
jgi:hypothetical protein